MSISQSSVLLHSDVEFERHVDLTNLLDKFLRRRQQATSSRGCFFIIPTFLTSFLGSFSVFNSFLHRTKQNQRERRERRIIVASRIFTSSKLFIFSGKSQVCDELKSDMF